MMNQTAYFHAFAYNPRTVDHDIWVGNATLAATKKAGLKADLSYPLYGDEKLAVDGWAFKAPHNKTA
jgi:hypothetical protein